MEREDMSREEKRDNRREQTAQFRKPLAMSDIEASQNRLRLTKEIVADVLSKIKQGKEEDKEMKEKLRGEGLKVKVIDADTGNKYTMRLKAWNKDKCHVLNGPEWRTYVSDKKLKKGDEIEVAFFKPSDSK